MNAHARSQKLVLKKETLLVLSERRNGEKYVGTSNSEQCRSLTGTEPAPPK
jgi:hypothetical protein